MLNWIVGGLILVGVLWFVWRAYFMFWGYGDAYDRAQEKDLKEYSEGMMLGEAHRHRDRVLRKARRD